MRRVSGKNQRSGRVRGNGRAKSRDLLKKRRSRPIKDGVNVRLGRRRDEGAGRLVGVDDENDDNNGRENEQEEQNQERGTDERKNRSQLKGKTCEIRGSG